MAKVTITLDDDDTDNVRVRVSFDQPANEEHAAHLLAGVMLAAATNDDDVEAVEVNLQ